MKITFFLSSLGGGGAERMTTILANNLVKNGYKVDLILGKKEGEYLKQLSKAVRVLTFKKLPNKRMRTALSTLPLIVYFWRQKPDVFISMMTNNNIVAALAHKLSRAKAKLILNERNHFTLGYQYMNPGRKKRLTQLAAWLYPTSDKIVVASHGVADDLAASVGIQRKMIHVVRNPVDLESIQAQANAPVDHSWINNPSTFVFLNVARLTKQKAQDNMIRAFSLVKNPNARLLIIGTGQRKNILEKIIHDHNLEDRVQLAGFTPNPYAYMAKSDAFILTSEWEGLPQVMTEAMACGLPVIMSDCKSGPREILSPDTDHTKHLEGNIELAPYGILTPTPTTRNSDIGPVEQQIALAMEYMLTDEKKRSYYSQKGQERAQDFTTDKWIQDWEYIIRT